jgi:hypothetical protein
MSRKELLQTIQDIENGLAMNPTGEILERLNNRLARAQKNLAALDEKKSESQPREDTGPANVNLPTVANMQEWAKGVQSKPEENDELLAWVKTAPIEPLTKEEQEAFQTFKQTRVSIGRASETSVTVPAVFVKIAGEDRLLTQTEIVGYLKTYFKRVATSERMKSGQYTAAYASDMGKTVWRLFDGWNLIYQETKEGSEWPPMVDIFPGWKNAQQAHKVTADVLWRWASNRKE